MEERRVWGWVALALGVLLGCQAPARERSPEVPTCTPGLLCNAMGNGIAAAPACLPYETRCAEGCVDLQTSPTSCGACGLACPAGQQCMAGACRPVCAQTLCSGSTGPECVSVLDDARHCGGCNLACVAGDICVAGRCVLDCDGLSECAGTCVDLQVDGAHCGACGVACAAGKLCQAGSCSCPGELASCGEACIDTRVDPEHCGACDSACDEGDVCEGGVCLGPDGCTDTPVLGLTLGAVDAYQTVQIPIMDEGVAIAAAMRNADVVAGRPTVLRIHVTPEAGWMPREVSARVELSDVDAPAAGQGELYFARITPLAVSSDADEDSTFQVELPAEAVGVDTRYSVTLVECAGAPPAAAPAEAASAARFPADGFEPLEARETGTLQVHILPLRSGGQVPDTSPEGLRAFEERLEAVFPVTDVIFTVGSPITSGATSMCSLLATVSAQRSQDSPPPNVYYYGLTNGILGGESGCSNANSTATGSKASAGWAQGFTPDDGSTGAATMCHELGHAHGRLHAPCRVQDPDRSYPYPDADIGVWGYDARNGRFYAPTRKDMMSYCPEPRSDAWISDYTYQAILERVVAVSALAERPVLALSSAPRVAWRLLVSDSAGLHWIDEPLMVRGTPEGWPVDAIVYGEQGPMQHIQVFLQELHDGVREGAFMLALPERDASWRAIEVRGWLPATAWP